MQITLFRHGIAQIRDGVIADADRKLTRKGIERTQLASVGLATCCMDASLILTSPKIRARQTAQMLADVLDIPIRIEQSLAQEQLVSIIGAIEQIRENHIVVVGHEPTLTDLAQYLCGNASMDRLKTKVKNALTLKKAGALSLEVDRLGTRLSRHGRLLWLLTPSILRNLGKPLDEFKRD